MSPTDFSHPRTVGVLADLCDDVILYELTIVLDIDLVAVLLAVSMIEIVVCMFIGVCVIVVRVISTEACMIVVLAALIVRENVI